MIPDINTTFLSLESLQSDPVEEQLEETSECLDLGKEIFCDSFQEFQSHFGLFKLRAVFPIENEIQHQIAVLFNLANRNGGGRFYTFLRSNESNLSLDYCRALYKFRMNGSSEEIVNLLKRSVIAMRLVNTLEYAEKIESWIPLFESNRLDLFKLSAVDLFGIDYNYSTEERYRIAVRSYQSVMRAFNLFSAIYLSKQKLMQQQFARYVQIHRVLRDYHQLNNMLLSQTPLLSRHQKIDLTKFFREAFQSFSQTSLRMAVFSSNVLANDIFGYYLTVISSDDVDLIANLTQEGHQAFDESYVEAHRGVYENFLPRVEEFLNMFTSLTESLSLNGRLLRSFHLYLKFGNLELLSQKLNASSPGYRHFEKIVRSEVLQFDSEIYNSGKLLEHMRQHLQNPSYASVLEFENYFSSLEELYGDFGNLGVDILYRSFDFAQLRTKDLYLFSPPKPSLSKPSGRLTRCIDIPSCAASSISAEPIEEIVEKEEFIAGASSSSSSEPNFSPLQQLEKMVMALKSLHGQSRLTAYGAKAAFDNSFINLMNLFSVVGRLAKQLPGPLKKGDVHTFIIDAIRYSSLTVEQIIAAFDRESNNIKTQQQISDRITHDMALSLHSCRFGNQDIPAGLRKIISQRNFGEILVRNLSQSKFGKGPLQTQLAKTWLFLKNNSTTDFSQLIQKELDHCSQALQLYFMMRKHIMSLSVKKPFDNEQEQQLQRDFNRLLEEIANQLQSVIHSPGEQSEEPALVGVDDAHSSHALSSSYTPDVLSSMSMLVQRHQSTLQEVAQQGELLDNVLLNHFKKLEIEVQEWNTEANLFHAPVYVSNVLLLTQMMLEELLNGLIDFEMINGEFVPDAEHHIAYLLTKLPIDLTQFTNEEKEFMESGKSFRQMARYLASFEESSSKGKLVNNPLCKATYDAMRNAQDLRNSQPSLHLGVKKGFKIANRNLRKKMDMLNKTIGTHLRLTESILRKVLTWHRGNISANNHDSQPSSSS